MDKKSQVVVSSIVEHEVLGSILRINNKYYVNGNRFASITRDSKINWQKVDVLGVIRRHGQQ